MSTLAQRINIARKARGLSQAHLAERMAISRGACGHWERGKASPSTTHLTKLASILNVRLDWLISGKGDMTVATSVSDSSTPSYSTDEFDHETREVADIFYRLSKRKREIILNLLREL